MTDMPPTSSKNRTERLNVRVTEAQARLIRLAATNASENISHFLIESSRLRAEDMLASQVHFTYTPSQWNEFVAMLDRPALSKRRLKKLLTEPSILERKSITRQPSERRKRA